MAKHKGKKQNATRPKAPPRSVSAGILAVLCVFAALLFIMVTAISPKRYTLSAGEVAPETIVATKDIVDELTTGQLEQQARDAVEMVYKQNEVVTQQVLNNIGGFFSAVSLSQVQAEDIRTQAYQSLAGSVLSTIPPVLQPSAKPTAEEWHTLLDTAQLQQLHANFNIILTDSELLALLAAEDTTLQMLRETVEQPVQRELSSGIKEDFLGETKAQLSEEIRQSSELPTNIVRIGVKIINGCLEPNMLYDEAATLEAQQQAADKVSPIVYKKGQNIVRQGDVITQSQLQVLANLGLLDADKVDIILYIGSAIFLWIIIMTMGAYIFLYHRQLMFKTSNLLMLGCIIVLTALMAWGLGRWEMRLMPMFSATMLICLLLSPRLAIVFNIFIPLICAMILGGASGLLDKQVFNIVFVNMISGVVGVMSLRRMRQRLQLVLAGAVVGVLNGILYLAIGFMSTSNIREALTGAGYSMVSAVLSVILVIGTLPLWEHVFKTSTITRLLELGNPQQPLLKKLMMEAPGTYHHSVLVANLAEGAAEAVGANPMLARVGAYYHDIGKLKHPYFFKENQVGTDNPHDRITPESSAAIILAHPKDGYLYAQRGNLPPAIQDIILQHHGTTPLLYFYHKACELSGQTLDVKPFRYAGPKPQTREAAIIMLADTAEAAVRVMNQPSAQEVKDRIAELTRTRLEDGQFDACDLTLKDIAVIIDALATGFKGILHERIEYPDAAILRNGQQEMLSDGQKA